MHRVANGDTPGPYSFTVTLMDLAGNPSGVLTDPSWIFEIDTKHDRKLFIF